MILYCVYFTHQLLFCSRTYGPLTFRLNLYIYFSRPLQLFSLFMLSLFNRVDSYMVGGVDNFLNVQQCNRFSLFIRFTPICCQFMGISFLLSRHWGTKFLNGRRCGRLSAPLLHLKLRDYKMNEAKYVCLCLRLCINTYKAQWQFNLPSHADSGMWTKQRVVKNQWQHTPTLKC